MEAGIIDRALSSCRLCARHCGVDRLSGEKGFCRAGSRIVVSRASLHHWEEPCISGNNGSGAVFFSGCSLNCVFCQNHVISRMKAGKEIDTTRLADIFMELAVSGAHNINLVTPTHFAPMIVQALDRAKSKGLEIPVIYNTGCYESLETLRMLDGYIDVYLPDLKYFDDVYACRYSGAPGYFATAAAAIDEMARQVGDPVFDGEGLIRRGVIVRHLMIPGLLFDTRKILNHLHNRYGDTVYISLMNQYTPLFNAWKYREINRTLNPLHYERMVEHCINLGIKNAFIQGSGSAGGDYVPFFDSSGC